MERGHHLSAQQRVAIAARYAAGNPVKSIAGEFGVSERTVSLTARKMGLALRVPAERRELLAQSLLRARAWQRRGHS